MNKRSRWLLVSGILLLLAPAIVARYWFPGRVSKSLRGPLETVTLSTAEHALSALIYVALDKGYFAAEGVDVILREKAAGKLALQEALEGKADLAASSETTIMYAVTSGAPVVVVATIAASDVDFAVVGRKDRGVTAVEDLKHKKIGLVKGTTAHYYLDRLLIDSGIHERDVTVVGVEASQIVAALIAENVDAIVIWNPLQDEARKKLGANAALLAKDSLVKSLWAISGHRDYLQRHPDTVKAVLKALVRAEAELLRQPEKARQIVAHNVGMDLPALQSVWRNYHFEVALDQSFIIALEEVSRWAIRKRHVSAERVPNFLHSIDISFLEAVRPETVQIIR